MCLSKGPQRSDAGEAWTRGPSVSSQALYHWATALPICCQVIENVFKDNVKVTCTIRKKRYIKQNVFTLCHLYMTTAYSNETEPKQNQAFERVDILNATARL